MIFQLIIIWTVLQMIASQCIYNYNGTSKSLIYLCENLTSENYVYYMDRLNPQIQKDVGSTYSLDIQINFEKSSFNELDNWITFPMTDQFKFWSLSKIFFNFSSCGINSIQPNTFDFSVSSYLYPALDLSFNNITNVNFLINNPNLQHLYLKNATNDFSIFKNILNQYLCKNIVSYIDLSYTNMDIINFGDFSCFPEINLSHSSIQQIVGPKNYGNKLNMILSKCENLLFINSTSTYIDFVNLDVTNINNFDIKILTKLRVWNILNLTNTNVLSLDKTDSVLSVVISRATILDMSNTNLEMISKQYFSGYSFQALNLSRNKLSILDELLFYDANIKEINLSNSQIVEIKKGCFEKLNTDKLILSNNNIANMETPFTNATITQLILSHNNISTLKNTFVFTEIKTLDLSFNPIQSIDSSSFASCLKLETLNLANTYIPYIADYTFRSLSTLKYLEISVSGNFHSEIFESLYLTSLTISNSNISYLQDGNFKGLYNLQNICFNNTVVSHLDNDALKYLVNVISLDTNVFKYLKVIPKGFFKDMLALTYLDLSHLQFESFEAGAFDGLINLKGINVTGSSLENDFNVISKLV